MVGSNITLLLLLLLLLLFAGGGPVVPPPPPPVWRGAAAAATPTRVEPELPTLPVEAEYIMVVIALRSGEGGDLYEG